MSQVSVTDLKETIQKHGYTLQPVYQHTSLQAFYLEHTQRMMPPRGSVWLPCQNFRTEALALLAKKEPTYAEVNRILWNEIDWQMMCGQCPADMRDWREISLETAETFTARYSFEWVKWMNVVEGHWAISPLAQDNQIHTLAADPKGYVVQSGPVVEKINVVGLPKPLVASIKTLFKATKQQAKATV